MIRIGLTSLLLLFVCGCSYLSKRGVNDLDAIEFAEMLCDQILLNQIAIEQFDMEELQSNCHRWRIYYKIFQRDGCVVSVWELNGCVTGIRIEPYVSSGMLMRYVHKNQDCTFAYVKPECAVEVINAHTKSCRLESVLGVQKANDALAYSREKFGGSNALSCNSPLYYFEIVDKENLWATLTLFSGSSWLIQVYRKS